MADAKRYYWLKLKENFFDDDVINWIEDQKNGKEYCLFYLKLCLKSLKNNGVLIRNVGTLLVPYDMKKLADITNTPEDTVIVAMSLFKKTGLVEVMENGALYLSQLQDMVGSESSWAKKKRDQRLTKGQSEDNVQQVSDRERERERDRDKSKREENDNSPACEKVVDEFQNVIHPLTNLSDLEMVRALANDYGPEWCVMAIAEARRAKNGNTAFLPVKYIGTILRNWKQSGGPPGSMAPSPIVPLVDYDEQRKKTHELIRRRDAEMADLARKRMGIS